MADIPFAEFVQRVVSETEPLSQNSGAGNLGFGWIYYGFIRNLRPDFVVSIGSRRGFTPFCAARAVEDNGSGKVILIDPSYSGGGHPGWGGGGFWSDPRDVEQRIASFNLGPWLIHLKQTSREAFTLVREMTAGSTVGLVIIDGSHTYEDSLEDFEKYSSLVSDGYVVFHDSTSGLCGVPETILTIKSRGYPLVTLHREVGLTIVEITRAPAVEQTWEYLCRISNRGALILRYAPEIIRPGDRVLDIYCGYSPLGWLLDDAELFGFDRDALIIEKLRSALPRHRWEQIDESYLPLARLPAEIDVLVGLGVSRGHASWDPQFAFESVCYLLGRYYPRACLFETAADYHGSDILDDLAVPLGRLGYSCREAIIETDMSSFWRRKLLIAVRP